MGWMSVNILAFALIILLQINGFLGCIQEERRGLLEIKKFFRLDNEEEDTKLLSWGDGKEYINCCNWERVTCHPVTGRVVVLDLANLSGYSSVYILNVSLFIPFNRIQFLDLSGNRLKCCANYAGFQELLNLKRLRKLNLALNDFNEDIFGSLGTLKPLKFLNLSHNLFEGFLPVKDLSALQDLETLDLSHNRFQGSLTAQDAASLSLLIKLKHLDLGHNFFNKHILKSISDLKALTFLSFLHNDMEGLILDELKRPNDNLEVLILRENTLTGSLPIQDLTFFKRLKVLDLSKNSFTGCIPQNVVLQTSLLALSLADNKLSSSLPTQGFCELRNLEELDLSRNTFEGRLPHCFTNLSSLRVLDLSMNRFKGDVSFMISNLTSLEYISLKSNEFEGELSLSLLANNSKLEIVELTNMGKLDVDTEISNWAAKFQLKVLLLSNCNLNKLTGKIPTFLSHQFMLKVVDLSNNNMRGSFPNWLLQNNARLQVLNLRNNSLVGKVLLPPQSNMSIYWFDLSSNRLTGRIGKDIGGKLLRIQYLNLSRNHFEGTISSSFCNMTEMIRLDLSYNNFHGEIPVELVAGCIFELYVLKLASNKFKGDILSTSFNLTSVVILSLEDNHFSGYVSNAITHSSNLKMLDISNNRFSGEISWISNILLNTAIMRNNVFIGRLPSKLPVYELLDIAHNHLSGPLPSRLDTFYWKHLVLQGNKLTGQIPDAFLNSSSLYTLDMRDNLLSGEIPKSIHVPSRLRVLLLGSNNLNGSIPKQICKLNKVTLIDLSNNKISGNIPRCINSISFGKYVTGYHIYTADIYIAWSSILPLATYGNFLVRDFIKYNYGDSDEFVDQVAVQFITKGRSNSYKGNILNYMSGMDLSYNNLTGEIPYQIGDLSSIHGLNLSHNHFTGSIPKTFDRLSQLESLDLSYNRLSGEIPMELPNLHFLEVFSVAYNNLSGRIPDMKAQFGTFDNNSYEGNPHLCGPPLEKHCVTSYEGLPNTPAISEEGDDQKWYEIDVTDCYITFIVSYCIFFLAVVVVLQVNPYWQRKLLNFVELCYYNIYGR